MMQSPFSYQSLYGVEHPFCKAKTWRKATSSILVSGGPAPKPAVRKERTIAKSTSALRPQSAFKPNGGDRSLPPFVKLKGVSRDVGTGQCTLAVLQTGALRESRGTDPAASARPDPAIPVHSTVQPMKVSHHLPGSRGSCETAPVPQKSRVSRDMLGSTARREAQDVTWRGAHDTTCTTGSEGRDALCTAADKSVSVPGLCAGALVSRPGQKSALLKFPLRTYHGKVGPMRPCAIEDIAHGLAHSRYKNVVVMSGAGTSTHSGIPDFRTPGTGLYDNLQQYNIPSPESIFDITYFAHSPKPFFALAKDLYPGKYAPNLVHYFVRLLQEKAILLRNYTQNIDGLERLAGVVPDRLVEAHGSFDTASCIKCGTKQDPNEVKEIIQQGRIPRCKQKPCQGLVKPDIVFFGQDLPKRFYSLNKLDFSQCDLLLIMGTSLEVEPFADLVSHVSSKTPRVLLNREVVRPFNSSNKRPNDMVMTGDLLESVQYLAREAGWTRDLEQLVSDETEGRTVSGYPAVPSDKREGPHGTLCAEGEGPNGTPCAKGEASGTLCTKGEGPSGTLCTKLSNMKLDPAK